MSQIFFIADTHFGHQNIIGYENRPFSSTKEMEEVLIENWNKTVKKEDKIYVLGDFAMASKPYIKEVLQQLRGYKILILGNHDMSYSFSWWQTSGFNEVIKYPIIYREWFMLSHEPLYVNNNMPYANIFGHVHGNPLYKDYSARSFCVSVERIHYKPITFEEIVETMKQNE